MVLRARLTGECNPLLDHFGRSVLGCVRVDLSHGPLDLFPAAMES